MIKKIAFEGNPKDDATRLEVKNILNELDFADEKYFVSIDYGTEEDGLYTVVTIFTMFDDDTWSFKETKYIK